MPTFHEKPMNFVFSSMGTSPRRSIYCLTAWSLSKRRARQTLLPWAVSSTFLVRTVLRKQLLSSWPGKCPAVASASAACMTAVLKHLISARPYGNQFEVIAAASFVYWPFGRTSIIMVISG